jgi:23S rRNA pseudouridine955/2504/2580 synthase
VSCSDFSPKDDPRTAAAPLYLRIEREQEGQRIDNFLLSRIKGVPRSRVYRVLRRGEVRVNKGRVKPGYRLRQGDLVRIPPLRAAAPPDTLSPSTTLLERLESAVLYEDERLLAVNKPAGLAVHGGSGLSFGLIEAMRVLRPSTGLELVHRLDRETSGCLLLAKRRSALRELHRLIRTNVMDKRYIALLVGRLPRRELQVDAPLRKNTLKSGERVVRVDSARGKPATTVFRRLRAVGDLTLVEAELVTGRTHQIRVHSAYLDAPVAGDEKYGEQAVNRRLRELGLKRLFLHAAALRFQPQFSASPIHIQAPLPPDLEAFLAAVDT